MLFVIVPPVPESSRTKNFFFKALASPTIRRVFIYLREAKTRRKRRPGIKTLLLAHNSHFAVQQGRNFKPAPAVGDLRGELSIRHQRPHASAADALREANADAQRPDADQFVDGLTPGSGVGQVDQVQDDPVCLAIEMAINEAGAAYAQRELVPCQPPDDVGEQLTVVGEIIPTEPSVEVRRKKGDPAARSRIQDKGCGFVARASRRFRRINRGPGSGNRPQIPPALITTP